MLDNHVRVYFSLHIRKSHLQRCSEPAARISPSSDHFDADTKHVPSHKGHIFSRRVLYLQLRTKTLIWDTSISSDLLTGPSSPSAGAIWPVSSKIVAINKVVHAANNIRIIINVRQSPVDARSILRTCQVGYNRDTHRRIFSPLIARCSVEFTIALAQGADRGVLC